MAVTVVGTGSAAATSVAIPAHQAGDLILVAARGAASTPTVPTAGGTVPAWTTLQSGVANSISLTVVSFVATGSTTTTGVFTNATQIAVIVLRGDVGNQLLAAAVRSSVGNGNNTQTIVYPALTFTDLDGSSFGVRVGTRGVAVAAVSTAPSGWTNRVVQPAGASALLAIHTRAAVTVSPTADSVSTAGTNAAYRAVTVEVLEQVPAQLVPVGGVPSAGSFGAARIPQTLAVGSVYPPGFVPSITGQVLCGDGHLCGGSPAAQFGAITIGTGVLPQTKPVAGLGSAQTFGAVTVKAAVSRQPAGLGSAQAFGALTVKSPITRQVTGLGSAQSFGAVSAKSAFVRAVAGIPSAQAFSTVTVIKGTVTSPNAGLPSAQAFGTVRFVLRFPVAGVPSAQAFGQVTTNLKRAVAGISSAQQFGTITLRTGASRQVAGISSAQAFGTVKLVRSVAVPGCGSAQNFGLVAFTTATRVAVQGVPSAQAFGVIRARLVYLAPTVPGSATGVPIVCVPYSLEASVCVPSLGGAICGQVICGDGHLCSGWNYLPPTAADRDVILTPVTARKLELEPV